LVDVSSASAILFSMEECKKHSNYFFIYREGVMKSSFFKALVFALFLVPVCAFADEGNPKPEPQTPPAVSLPLPTRCRILCPLIAIKNAIVAHPKLVYGFLTVSFLAGASVGGYFLYQNMIANQTDATNDDKIEEATPAAAVSTSDAIADRLPYCTIKNLNV